MHADMFECHACVCVPLSVSQYADKHVSLSKCASVFLCLCVIIIYSLSLCVRAYSSCMSVCVSAVRIHCAFPHLCA